MESPGLDALVIFIKCLAVVVLMALAVRALTGCGGAPFDIVDAGDDAGSEGGGVVIVTSPEAAPDSGAAPETGAGPDAGPEACTSLIKHSNGIGQTWTDCAPLSTYDEVEAISACESNSVLHSPYPACDVNMCGGSIATAFCNVDVSVPGFCTCWTFAGPGAGRVLSHACDLDAGPGAATCAGPGNDSWE
jgi:hypothetical protein